MIGIVLVSHGPLAAGLRQAAEMIMGAQDAVAALTLEPAQDMDRFRADLEQAVQALDSGQGVLILADLFGGSPANTAAYVMGPAVEVVCGASLPMLLEVLGARPDADLAAVTATALRAGREAPVRMAEILGQP